MPKSNNKSVPSPEALFDFDGTLMHLPHKFNLYGRMTKRGLYSKLGATDFIRGLISEGVEVGPIVSRRPPLRMKTTRASIGAAGLTQFFPDASNVILAGSTASLAEARASEQNKARVVVEHAEHKVVGMVEDKPHKLGRLLIDELLEIDATREPIVLGIVPSPKRDEMIKELVDYARTISGLQYDQSVSQDGDLMAGHTFAYTGDGPHFTMQVTKLEPFSFESGQQFAKHLNAYTF